jgi:hypothetical protein
MTPTNQMLKHYNLILLGERNCDMTQDTQHFHDLWNYDIDNHPKDQKLIDILIKSKHLNDEEKTIRQTDVYFCSKKQDWYLSNIHTYLGNMTGDNQVIAWMPIMQL